MSGSTNNLTSLKQLFSSEEPSKKPRLPFSESVESDASPYANRPTYPSMFHLTAVSDDSKEQHCPTEDFRRPFRKNESGSFGESLLRRIRSQSCEMLDLDVEPNDPNQEYWNQLSQQLRTELETIKLGSEMIEEDLEDSDGDHQETIELVAKIQKSTQKLLEISEDIEKRFHLEQEKRLLAERLKELGSEVNKTFDADEILKLLLASVTLFLKCNVSYVFQYDEKLGLQFRLGWLPKQGFIKYCIPLDSVVYTLLNHTALNCKPGIASVEQSRDQGAPGFSLLAVPVVVAGTCVAVCLLMDQKTQYTTPQAKTAMSFSRQASTAFENAARYQSMQRLSTLDELTGLFNRRHFTEMANAYFQPKSPERYLSAMMLDIDRFKSINDAYGHPVGDDVLQVVAERLRHTVRDSDILARYGGEEFCLLLPDADQETARRVGERLRKSICNAPIGTRIGPLSISVSIGVASLHPKQVHEFEEVSQLLGEADVGLYQAKEGGRNRVVCQIITQ